MEETERRNNYRVDAPAGFLREVAVWRDRAVAGNRLSLEELGAPDAVGMAGGGGIAVTDVSTRGLRLRLSADVARRLRFESGGVLPSGELHVYLKLLSPAPCAETRNCTLFLGTRVTHVEHADGDVLLGLHITSRGVPERAEKAFRMFDAGRYGVKELTRWCDEVARMGRGILPAPSPGLDLEHLLAEIDAVHACGDVQANRN